MAEYLSQRELRRIERERNKHRLELERLELQNAVERERSRRKAEGIRKRKAQREIITSDYERELTEEERKERERIRANSPTEAREINRRNMLAQEREIICQDNPARQGEIIEEKRNIMRSLSGDDFEDQMRWINDKLMELKAETAYTEDRQNAKGRFRNTNENDTTDCDLEMDSFGDREYDEEEEKLIKKIEHLRSQEEDMTREIKQRKDIKEKERRSLIEKDKRIERIKELKERERSLEESIVKKKYILRQMECSSEDDCNVSQMTWSKRRAERKRDNGARRCNDVVYRRESSISLKKPTIPRLTEDTFEEWKMEVEVVLESGLYHEDIVRQEVRNSLSGNTRKILLNINPDATTRQLVTKLENLYGNIRSGESILAEFYKATQNEHENIAEWGVRVESLLNTALRKGQILPSQANEMLRNRFWRYLKDDKLKNATRMYYDSGIDFEELRRRVRIEENEMEVEKNMLNVNRQQITDENYQTDILNKLLERMARIEEKLAKQESMKESERNNGVNERKWDNGKESSTVREGQDKRDRNYNRSGYSRNDGGYSRRNDWRDKNGRHDESAEGGQYKEGNRVNRGESDANDRKDYKDRQSKDLNE